MTVSEFGIQLRHVEPPQNGEAPAYYHQDDYYIIGLLNNGTCRISIDFKEYTFSKGDIVIIYPKQIHNIMRADDAEGWLLFVDSSIIEKEEKYILDKLLLFTPSVKIDEKRNNELNHIALIIIDRIHNINNNQIKTTVKMLTKTFISIIAESIISEKLQHEHCNSRHIEMTLNFCNLVKNDVIIHRSPSYYAKKLNISSGYLNEIIKGTLGTNTSSYIKNELILQTKRLLAHTNLTVKEISSLLGMDDHAYFSRLFSRMTGVSPSLFRQKNLE